MLPLFALVCSIESPKCLTGVSLFELSEFLLKIVDLYSISKNNFFFTYSSNHAIWFKSTDATYQRVMITIFHDMLHECMEDYVGDIIVKSKKFVTMLMIRGNSL